MTRGDHTTFEAEGWLADADRSKLKAIYQLQSACFSDLVIASGLNPSVDFRYADLTGVDFNGSDLRGFNLVGANLSYTRWFKANWDETTNIEGAILTGAKGFGRSNFRGTLAEQPVQPFFENTPMAIATVDKFGSLVRANSRFVTLRASLNFVDEQNSVLSIVDGEYRQALAKAIHRASEGHNDAPPVAALLSAETERWGEFFAIADDPVKSTVHLYVLDITERRRLEGQLNQAQKMEMVGQLAGGIAHDFNNVLSAIMMANDFLLNAHKPTDPEFQDIMQIKQNATRGASLVRQLLAFSRRQTLRPIVVGVGDALSDLSMLLRRLIGDNVRLEVVHGRDLWDVKVDVSQFEQVIVNLVVNARDAMPNGGTLTLQTSNLTKPGSLDLAERGVTVGEYVRIDVIDTGAGIPPEIVTKIFEPFFSTKEIGKGTGLGLSTVYGIVKQSRGYIFVDSSVKTGAKFSVLLPRSLPAEEAGPVSMFRMVPWHQAADAVDVETISLLLVEPDDGLRLLHGRALRARGYQVVEAADGVEALAVYLAHGNRFDVVVSEIALAEMDGPTLYREIRKRNPEQSFIFVSGYAEDTLEQRFPENEVIAFLPKPFGVAQLVVAITNEIGLRIG